MALGKVADLGNFIRDQRRTARLSLRKLSGMAGISNPYLSQIERGLRRPSAEILQAIAKALRVSAETMYVKAGILEERGETDPVASLLNDLSLNEKQKQVLIDIYQSFRHENELEGSRAPKPAADKPEKRAEKRKNPKAPRTEKRAAALAKRAATTSPRARTSAKSASKKKTSPRSRAASKKRSAR